MKKLTGFEMVALVQSIPSNKKNRLMRAVLLALAKHHPNIWPSVATIARESGYTSRSVSTMLTILLTQNIISVREDSDRKGGCQSTRYVFNVDAVRALVPAKPTHEAISGVPLKSVHPTHEMQTGTHEAISGVPLKPLHTNQSVNKQRTKQSTKVPATKVNPIVAKTVDTLLLLFFDEEQTPLKPTAQQRANLREHIVAYGPELVTAAWKKWLKVRSSHVQPLYDFNENFVVWLRQAENDPKYADRLWEIRCHVAYNCAPPGWYIGFRETLTPEEIEPYDLHCAWMRQTRDDPCRHKTCSLSNAGYLLDLHARGQKWYDENEGAWIEMKQLREMSADLDNDPDTLVSSTEGEQS